MFYWLYLKTGSSLQVKHRYGKDVRSKKFGIRLIIVFIKLFPQLHKKKRQNNSKFKIFLFSFHAFIEFLAPFSGLYLLRDGC